MIRTQSEISGYAIHATDGLVGTVSDFLFEDTTWLVRWLVIDTGDWLRGRNVLLPLSALAHVNHIGHQFNVKLTRQQVKDCPNIETDQPVSRQQETSLYDYYGWSPYWGGGANMGMLDYMGLGGYWGYVGGPMAPPPSPELLLREREIDAAERSKSDPTLRSIKEVIGYHIDANDGEIGHVNDILVEDTDWSIHYLVVDTKNWWPGKKVLISPLSVREIRWTDRMVSLGVNRQMVKESPAYDPSIKVDPIYESAFHKHYDHSRQLEKA
jgi:sporulation protein YlmC with PRC-barrel domain